MSDFSDNLFQRHTENFTATSRGDHIITPSKRSINTNSPLRKNINNISTIKNRNSDNTQKNSIVNKPSHPINEDDAIITAADISLSLDNMNSQESQTFDTSNIYGVDDFTLGLEENTKDNSIYQNQELTPSHNIRMKIANSNPSQDHFNNINNRHDHSISPSSSSSNNINNNSNNNNSSSHIGQTKNQQILTKINNQEYQNLFHSSSNNLITPPPKNSHGKTRLNPNDEIMEFEIAEMRRKLLLEKKKKNSQILARQRQSPNSKESPSQDDPFGFTKAEKIYKDKKNQEKDKGEGNDEEENDHDIKSKRNNSLDNVNEILLKEHEEVLKRQKNRHRRNKKKENKEEEEKDVFQNKELEKIKKEQIKYFQEIDDYKLEESVW